MSSPEAFLAFGTVMLVVALLAVAIDWFGKPMRHRRFVAKMYRYPDERGPRRVNQAAAGGGAEATSASVPATRLEAASPTHPGGPAGLLLAPPEPTSRPPSPYPDGAGGVDHASPESEPPTDATASPPGDPRAADDPDAGTAEPDATIGHPEESAPESAEVDGSAASTPPARGTGWSPGEYVYNLTEGGLEPSPSTIRNRYWKNVAASPGARIFGVENLERMAEGLAPQRRNARTGKLESMRLTTVAYDESNGALPVPSWPDKSIDPFAP